MQAKNRVSNEQFRQVYDRQFARLYKLALFLTGNQYDAEDTLQTVFTRYLTKRPRFKDAEHETAWFITVTKNLCRDFHKEYYRKNTMSMDAAGELPVAFSSKEDSDLWNALAELPQKYRTLLYLYYYEGYSVRELSEILHKKESTLQTQLADGRKKLRTILEAD